MTTPTIAAPARDHPAVVEASSSTSSSRACRGCNCRGRHPPSPPPKLRKKQQQLGLDLNRRHLPSPARSNSHPKTAVTAVTPRHPGRPAPKWAVATRCPSPPHRAGLMPITYRARDGNGTARRSSASPRSRRQRHEHRASPAAAELAPAACPTRSGRRHHEAHHPRRPAAGMPAGEPH